MTADPGITVERHLAAAPDSVWRAGATASSADGGSLLHEEWYDRRGVLMTQLGTIGTGVADRGSHNRGTMEATLDALVRELGRTEA